MSDAIDPLAGALETQRSSGQLMNDAIDPLAEGPETQRLSGQLMSPSAADPTAPAPPCYEGS